MENKKEIKKMQNSNWITWKIDKKMKFPLNNMEN